MGKKSKKNKTGGGGGKSNSLLNPSFEFFAQLKSLEDGTEERRRLGSSAYDRDNTGVGDRTRIIDEAESLQCKAHAVKQAGNIQEAHELYTAAIELDKYNHYYFYQRAATACKGKQWELGRHDCQFGLDLCVPVEDYVYDECFSMLWWTLTLCCMETFQWEKANEYCEMGLLLIGNSDKSAFALKELREYRTEIKHMLRNTPTDYAPAMMKSVRNGGNDLGFMYTAKAASLRKEDIAPDQHEILVVDVLEDMPTKEMFECVWPEKIKAWQDSDVLEKDDKSVFQVPDTNYWVTVIPVWGRGDRRSIRDHLMCDCLKNTKIVILKLEKSDEPPVVGDTAAYVSSIVKNASKCEEIYNRGRKLVEG